MARQVANEIGMGNGFHEGVYTMLGGPNFGKDERVNYTRLSINIT